MVNLMADYWFELGAVLEPGAVYRDLVMVMAPLVVVEALLLYLKSSPLNHLTQIQSYLRLEMLDFHELLVLNFVVLQKFSNKKPLGLSSDKLTNEK